MAAPEWLDSAACLGEPLDLFYPVGAGGVTGQAHRLCAGCPVRAECLDEVMAQERGARLSLRYGYRAGLTPRQRWRLAQRRGEAPDASARRNGAGTR